MSLQDAQRSTHRTVARASHADTVVHQFCQVRLPQSFKKQSNAACSAVHVVMANRMLSLSHHSRLEIEKETGNGSSQRSLHRLCHNSGRSLQRATPSSSSAFHQKRLRLTSEAPQVLPGFKFARMLRSWLCYDEQNVSSLRKIVRAIEHSRYVLMTLRHGRLFAEQLTPSLLPHCEFLVVCYSQKVLKSSVAAQEEIVRTQRLPLLSTLLALLISASESWPRRCTIDVDFGP